MREKGPISVGTCGGKDSRSTSLHPSIQLTYIFRNINVPTHLLTKLACGISDIQLWIEEVPNSVKSTILEDKFPT